MKKQVQIILVVCLTITTLVFAFLWQNEKNNKDDLRLLAQASAKETYINFTEYQANGQENDYWNGVAAFRSFEQAYYN